MEISKNLFDMRFFTLIFFILLGNFSISWAYDPQASDPVSAEKLPRSLKGAKITPHLGQSLNQNIIFRDHNDKPLKVGSLLATGKPTLLSFVYYRCPSLCNFHLNGVKDVLMKMKSLKMGRDFNLVSVSFDHRERPFLAKEKRSNYLKDMNLDLSSKEAKGWQFLTGNKKAIKKLADLAGFGYHWDVETQQYAHSSALILLSPEGVITHYLNGISFDPVTLRLALVDSSQGVLGDFVDKLVLYCFQFDPKKSKYTIYAWNMIRISGGLTTVLVVGLLSSLFYRERRKKIGKIHGF